jgi:cell division protein FtsB
MTNQPSKIIRETGKLANLVAPEQRPQLIVLVLVILFFQALILTSDLSAGLKIFLAVPIFIGFLWLAIFVIPKQLKGVESIQEELNKKKAQNQVLKDSKMELKKQISDTENRLSDAITDARSCLEDIDNKVAAIKERTQEEHTRNHLIDIHHYISVKKRELNSALARVSSGSQMIETKEAAGSDLVADFRALQENQASSQSSQDIYPR